MPSLASKVVLFILGSTDFHEWGILFTRMIVDVARATRGLAASLAIAIETIRNLERPPVLRTPTIVRTISVC